MSKRTADSDMSLARRALVQYSRHFILYLAEELRLLGNAVSTFRRRIVFVRLPEGVRPGKFTLLHF